jgi:RimJ/RimL family protein N-acetyltransferase
MEKLKEEIPQRIETNRLILRPYQKGDGSALFNVGLRNREHLSRFESGNFLLQIKDEDHAESEIKELINGWGKKEFFFFGIFEKEFNDWVGQVYIGPKNLELPEFTIGYIVDVNHQRRGYITEAILAVTQILFEVVGAHRIQAECSEENTRSWQLLERCGFIREGHLRETKTREDGSYSGDYIYSMLKTEFKSNQMSHPKTQVMNEA